VVIPFRLNRALANIVSVNLLTHILGGLGVATPTAEALAVTGGMRSTTATTPRESKPADCTEPGSHLTASTPTQRQIIIRRTMQRPCQTAAAAATGTKKGSRQRTALGPGSATGQRDMAGRRASSRNVLL
jgi:hypothetical protein